jgi:hypothetical protein
MHLPQWVNRARRRIAKKKKGGKAGGGKGFGAK